MTTRAELRDRLRRELDDSGVAQLWSDALLNDWIADAIGHYERHQPREASTTLQTVAGQADYALPGDTLHVLDVEHPAGIPRTPWHADAAPHEQTYRVWGATLTLDPAPGASGEEIALRYLATYPRPTQDPDVLQTPAADDHLLVLYAAWRALVWVGASEAKRQRFERQRGATAADEAQRYRQALEDELQARGRVRSRQLHPRT